jgi:hypothetical protein
MAKAYSTRAPRGNAPRSSRSTRRRGPTATSLPIPPAAELRDHYERLAGYRLLADYLERFPSSAAVKMRSTGDINTHYRWATGSGAGAGSSLTYVQRGQPACQAIASGQRYSGAPSGVR